MSIRAGGERATESAAVRPRALDGAARLATLLFVALMLLHVLPIWIVGYFPTQDGPVHLENISALIRWARSPLLERWYVPNPGLQPNWLTQVVTAGLLLLVSPETAQRIVLTGFVVLLPLAFRYALPGTPRGRWLALAIFPFIYSFPFHMGFWNFSYSLVFFFVIVGFWNRTRGRMSTGRALAFSLLLLVTYFCHSVSLAMALAAIGTLLAWRAILSLRRSRTPERRRWAMRAYARRAAPLVLASLPAVALTATFVLRHRGHPVSRVPFLILARNLAMLYALVSLDRREALASALVVLAIAGTATWLLATRPAHGLRRHDGWLGVAAIAAVLYFATPEVVAAGAHISDRLALYPFLAILLWIAGRAAGIRSAQFVALALACAALLGLGVRIAKYREIDGYLKEYVSADRFIPTGSVVLPLTFSPWGPLEPNGRKLAHRIKVFLHAAGYIATDRDVVDLDNSQGNTDHCPLEFVPSVNPFRTLVAKSGELEATPPCVRLSSARGEIDYVLVWGANESPAAQRSGATPDPKFERCGAEVREELAARYERVYVSEPRGLLEIYRPRDH